MELLQAAVEGYAVTIFAYGQTGSGKTYTMTGPESLDVSAEVAVYPTQDGPHGLIPRGVAALFSIIEQLSASGSLAGGCAVRASYLELYNETINDLLNPESTNLRLRDHAKTGAFVESLLQVDCEDVGDAMMVFAEGTRNRKVGSHNLNKDSSRSHCMMTLYISRRDILGPGGRISFVDLAGSERLPDSQSRGEAAKETGHINRSLFALGNVISALADSRKRGGHIPYRASKLTRLLMDSLGGDGRTLMLACCSPSSAHLDETLNTLNFASRTKNIQNRPVAQTDGGAPLLLQMQQAMRALQEENSTLRARLAQQPPSPQPHLQQPQLQSQPQPQQLKEKGGGVPAPSSGGKLGIAALRAVSGAPACVLPGGSGRGASSISTVQDTEKSDSDSLEVAALRQEVSQLRLTNDLLKRSHENVLLENRNLQAKLERLEQVFASGAR